MKLNSKQKKGILFCLLLVVGLQVFYLAVYGFATTPFYDAVNDIVRCPDWQFHECYASTLDLALCSEDYASYMPLIHFASAGLSWLSLLPVVFWLALFCSASVCLMTVLLWSHSNTGLGGVVSVSVFLLGLPLVFFLLTGNAVYSWINLTVCGLIPFIVASALFCFLLLEARGLSFKQAFLVFVLIVVSHNYGFVLAVFALFCLSIEFYSKQRLKATWIALTSVFIWIVVFSPYYFTYGSERVIFLLYFLVSLELGRLLSGKGVV